MPRVWICGVFGGGSVGLQPDHVLPASVERQLRIGRHEIKVMALFHLITGDVLEDENVAEKPLQNLCQIFLRFVFVFVMRERLSTGVLHDRVAAQYAGRVIFLKGSDEAGMLPHSG
jgi:hypothetical protein